MRAGYPWTWQLERMLAIVLPMPIGPERQQYLEILGGLDMNVWIVGRQSPPLHIWANYCLNGQGIEEVTGLPRSLLDLISLVSRGKDVSGSLQQYAAMLPQMRDTLTETCRALVLSARIYLQEEPLFPISNELFTLVTCLKQQMLNSDLGILAWPAYTLGSRGASQECRFLAEDILSMVSASCLPDGVTALRGSPLGAMRRYWASVGILNASLTRDCDGAEIGLW
ncbi:unnamed protein product [Fusarium equiseti]|uniref:Uncharacterized protein n=1 Tax=Fusarium equiseti TaxID=61235 RepID=A0A8J2IG05_FUSEQ|nr:unnamed protein product [Fusarium equiseti]